MHNLLSRSEKGREARQKIGLGRDWKITTIESGFGATKIYAECLLHEWELIDIFEKKPKRLDDTVITIKLEDIVKDVDKFADEILRKLKEAEATD